MALHKPQVVAGEVEELNAKAVAMLHMRTIAEQVARLALLGILNLRLMTVPTEYTCLL